MVIGPEYLFSYTPTYDNGWKVKVTDKFYAKVLRKLFKSSNFKTIWWISIWFMFSLMIDMGPKFYSAAQ